MANLTTSGQKFVSILEFLVCMRIEIGDNTHIPRYRFILINLESHQGEFRGDFKSVLSEKLSIDEFAPARHCVDPN